MRRVFVRVIAAVSMLIGTVTVCAEPPQAAKDAEAKGEAAAETGDFDSAISKYNEAIRLDPKFALAYSFRGVAYSRKHDFKQAMADSNEAISLNARSTAIHIHRGWLFFDRREYDKAIADYSEAIRIDPKCAGAFIDRSQSYDYKGEYEKAMLDAKEALRLEPKSHKANNEVGIAYDSYARAVFGADDKTAEALFNRASVYFDAPPIKLGDAPPILQVEGSMDMFRLAARKLDRASKGQLLFDYSATYFKRAVEIKPDYDFGNNNFGVYLRGKARHTTRQRRKSISAKPSISARDMRMPTTIWALFWQNRVSSTRQLRRTSRDWRYGQAAHPTITILLTPT